MVGIMVDDGSVISGTGSLSIMMRTWPNKVLWTEFADGIHDYDVVDEDNDDNDDDDDDDDGDDGDDDLFRLRYIVVSIYVATVTMEYDNENDDSYQWPLLLTWFSFGPGMDVWSRPLWGMGWSCLFIPKLQRLHRWGLGMDEWFCPTFPWCTWLLVHAGIGVGPC